MVVLLFPWFLAEAAALGSSPRIKECTPCEDADEDRLEEADLRTEVFTAELVVVDNDKEDRTDAEDLEDMPNDRLDDLFEYRAAPEDHADDLEDRAEDLEDRGEVRW